AGTILCVSHDRYFLSKIIRRLLVIEPPKVVDFQKDYNEWVARVQQVVRKPDKSAPVKPQAPVQKSVSKLNNPYSRPFGRLTLEDLEKQIIETEIALAECQEQFADGDNFKDPALGKRVHEEYDALSQKLRDLEEEYFLREG